VATQGGFNLTEWVRASWCRPPSPRKAERVDPYDIGSQNAPYDNAPYDNRVHMGYSCYGNARRHQRATLRSHRQCGLDLASTLAHIDPPDPRSDPPGQHLAWKIVCMPLLPIRNRVRNRYIQEQQVNGFQQPADLHCVVATYAGRAANPGGAGGRLGALCLPTPYDPHPRFTDIVMAISWK
jgi:hypothetical protein